jgi:lysophospholipase L1-like esterase
LVKRFDVECEARQPNIVIFAIGSNDCTIVENKEATVPLDIFQKNIAFLTEKAKKFTDKIVFVGPIICDETKTIPIPRAPELSQDMKTTIIYNDAIKSFCASNDTLFIDMLDVLDTQDLEDGIHPTAQGHEKIYIRIRDILLEKKII